MANVQCVERCAKHHDGAMVECLRLASRVKRMTHDQGQDECSIKAAEAFEECSSECYGSWYDPLGGWTPEREDGTYKPGESRDTFLVPRQKVERNVDGTVDYVAYYKT
jgi:hypothetical protein